MSIAGVATANDSGSTSSTSTAKISSVCCQPTLVEQRDRERREQELAERSGRGADPEREGAHRFRQQLAERREHDR